MNLASLIISSLSLIAVIIIGRRSIRLGQQAALSGQKSAEASDRAAQATAESAAASSRAAEATERSVAASERAASLAERDARYRRLESILDVLITMREMFNEQVFPEHERDNWTPARNSPEQLARLALRRRLEGRLVPFEAQFDDSTNTCQLALSNVDGWSTSQLEGAITELKQLLWTVGNDDGLQP
jgi:hypothetical protein